MTRAELLRRLAAAPQGGRSAVIADASDQLGSLQAVYALLDGQATPAHPELERHDR